MTFIALSNILLIADDLKSEVSGMFYCPTVIMFSMSFGAAWTHAKLILVQITQATCTESPAAVLIVFHVC